MGPLISILLALASLAFDDLGLTGERQVPWAVPALVCLPYLIVAAQRRASLRGHFRRAAGLGRLVLLVPVLGQYAAVSLFGWQRSVEGWLGVRLSLLEWPHLGLFAAFAPFVLYTLATIDAEARLNAEHGGLRRNLRRFQLRMFAGGLAPIAVYLFCASLLGRSDSLRIHVEEVALFGAGFSGVTLLGFVYGLPWLLQHSWETEPLAWGPERALLERVGQLASFRCKELLLWRTGGLMANAAIVGVTPGSRRVFFSDALLRRLGPRELAAVYAHEIGHARQHHVPLFIAWALAFFAGLDLVALEADPEGGALGLAVLGVGLALWLVGFGWLSRRVELEADLFALELLGEGAGLASALDAVAPGRSQKSGWRHFGMARRVQFLERAAADPGVGRSLRAKLRVARWSGAIALFAVLSLQLVHFAQSYSEDQVRADLRLGRYASAAERLARVEGPPEDLAELVELAHAAFPADFSDRDSAASACAARALEAGGDEALVEAWWLLTSVAGGQAPSPE